MTEQPCDLQAERAVLGALMLAPHVIDEVLNIVVPEDFYGGGHNHIFAAIRKLYTDGSRVDTVLVAEELDRQDQLKNIGGPGALIDIQAGTPSTSNAARYAAIVVQRANARSLIAECDVAIQSAYDLEDPEEVRDQLESALSGMVVASEGADGAISIDEFMKNYKTEDRDEQWIVDGLLKEGWRCVIVAKEGGGKRLPLTTPIRTIDGWSTIGDIEVGETIFDRYGKPCTVTMTHPIETQPDAYTITFSDGSTINADGEHNWLTVNYRDRQAVTYPQGRPADSRDWTHRVHTTKQIQETLKVRNGHVLNHALTAAGPLDLPEVTLPIDPYTLGVWLGDGTSASGAVTLNNDDFEEIAGRVEAAGWSIGLDIAHKPDGYGATTRTVYGLKQHLRELGVLDNKHIPAAYLNGSIEQRLALLQGLADTDGHIANGSGSGRGQGVSKVEMCFTNKQLADDTNELVTSLGWNTKRIEGNATYTLDGVRHDTGRRYRTFFTPDLTLNPFNAKRKAARVQQLRTQRSKLLYVTDVTPCEPEPMRCLTVDSPDHSFLVGRNLLPTHNTTLMRQFALACAQGVNPFTLNPLNVGKVSTLIVDCENPDDSIYEVCHPITQRIERWFDTGRSLGEYENDSAWLYHKPEGINLRSRVDATKLDTVISTLKPKLVVAGPLYKMYDEQQGDGVHTAIRATLRTLDKLRTRHGFALMLEHHAPHGHAGSREMRPEGSSLLLRWPELGIGMTPHKERGQESKTHVKLTKWRNDRARNSWPLWIQRELEMSDNHMPWRAAQEPRSNTDFEGAYDDDY